MVRSLAAAGLLLVACGRERIDVEGLVVGSLGLPVAGVQVVVTGHAPTTSDASGRFVVLGVKPPYNVLVGVHQPEFQRAFASAWLGLRRSDPVLALANSWPQVGARYATVCGTASGAVSFPATAPWVVLDPSAPFGALPQIGHVDPSSGTYCAGASWTGAQTHPGAVHVLAVETFAAAGADFVATGFPAAGTLDGLSLSDGAQLAGASVPLAAADPVALAIDATGPAAPHARLFVSAYYGGAWPGRGVPLASVSTPPPWPSVAIPAPTEPSVRVEAWSWPPSGGVSWRERTLASGVTSTALELPAVPAAIEPPDGGHATIGTRFRWAPASAETVSVLQITADLTDATPLTDLVVYAASPDVQLPDFSVVGVPVPVGATGIWLGRVTGPLSGMDALVTPEQLGFAFHSGRHVSEWVTAATPLRTLNLGP